MSAWEYDDETMVQMYDQYGRNKQPVEFVPEMQLDDQVEAGEVESEIFNSTQPNVVIPRIGSVLKTVIPRCHPMLREVIARENPNRLSSSMMDRSVLC